MSLVSFIKTLWILMKGLSLPCRWLSFWKFQFFHVTFFHFLPPIIHFLILFFNICSFGFALHLCRLLCHWTNVNFTVIYISTHIQIGWCCVFHWLRGLSLLISKMMLLSIFLTLPKTLHTCSCLKKLLLWFAL